MAHISHESAGKRLTRSKERGLKRDAFLSPHFVTQEGRAFCAEGLYPSYINRLESIHPCTKVHGFLPI